MSIKLFADLGVFTTITAILSFCIAEVVLVALKLFYYLDWSWIYVVLVPPLFVIIPLTFLWAGKLLVWLESEKDKQRKVDDTDNK